LVDGRLSVPAKWTKRGTHFALRVDGDSMEDAGILKGDYVVVRQQATARDGEVVVAVIEGETTLKRFRRTRDKVVLEAANPEYKPIEIRSSSAGIQGVVVGLMREYRVQQVIEAAKTKRYSAIHQRDVQRAR